MTKRHWKALLGARLKEMRERSHGGKGMTHEKVAQTIKRSETYVVHLETEMETENPTINVLDAVRPEYIRVHPWMRTCIHVYTFT